MMENRILNIESARGTAAQEHSSTFNVQRSTFNVQRADALRRKFGVRRGFTPLEISSKSETKASCGVFLTGFTLVETVVASAILCGAVLVIAAISTRAVTGTRLNRQYEMAALVADRQLRLIDYVGIDNFIESGEFEGVVDQFEPVYYWKVATEYQDIDSLYLVAITVSWMEGNHPYSITVDTMLDGASVYATESTGSTTSTGGATSTGSTGSTGTQ